MQVEDPKGNNINMVNVNSEPVFDFIFHAKPVEDVDEQENNCKICYGYSDDNDNPLVHLCRGICFVHYKKPKEHHNQQQNAKKQDKNEGMIGLVICTTNWQ